LVEAIFEQKKAKSSRINIKHKARFISSIISKTKANPKYKILKLQNSKEKRKLLKVTKVGRE
jgi:hypothetical protein